ncbi:hypothetical protein ACWKWU_09960 [Chitinophaga lutea]
MKVIRYAMLTFLALTSAAAATLAQDAPAGKDTVTTAATKKRVSYHFHFYAPAPPRKGYVTAGGNGGLLSFAKMSNEDGHIRNIPRFTLFFNIGTNYNYDFTNNFGIFSGLNIKNIGLISKPNDSVKLKQRVYTLGVPVGIKLGNFRSGTFFFAGGEYDLAFNYKEKYFLNGDKETKFNEWFSDRTPTLMPSVFAGFRMSPGFGVKVQYYLNDFFNKDFTQTVNGVKEQPYKNMDANLVFVTLSYNFGIKCKTKTQHTTTTKFREGGKVIVEKKTTVVEE